MRKRREDDKSTVEEERCGRKTERPGKRHAACKCAHVICVCVCACVCVWVCVCVCVDVLGASECAAR